MRGGGLGCQPGSARAPRAPRAPRSHWSAAAPARQKRNRLCPGLVFPWPRPLLRVEPNRSRAHAWSGLGTCSARGSWGLGETDPESQRPVSGAWGPGCQELRSSPGPWRPSLPGDPLPPGTPPSSHPRCGSGVRTAERTLRRVFPRERLTHKPPKPRVEGAPDARFRPERAGPSRPGRVHAGAGSSPARRARFQGAGVTRAGEGRELSRWGRWAGARAPPSFSSVSFPPRRPFREECCCVKPSPNCFLPIVTFPALRPEVLTKRP